MTDLRKLDDRFLSAAAPKAARAVGKARDRARAVSQGVENAKSAARDVDLKDLSALDDRYARAGLLGFFREVPQLMAVVTGIVFIFGTIVAGHQLRDRQTGGEEQTVVTDPGGSGNQVPTNGTLGPPVGSAVSTYLTKAATGLTSAARTDPDEPMLALVSFGAYYRPNQAASIVSGYVAQRAYLRVSSAGALAPQLPVDVSGDVLEQLTAYYARQAKGQAEAAAGYHDYVTTTADPAYKDFYKKYEDLSRKQAVAFGDDCACVFAVIVKATPQQLLSLRSRPGVRALEVAGKGLGPADLDIVPLLPEVKGVVPEPQPPVEPPS